MADALTTAKLPHFVITSPCGRVWHLPHLKVREDYARYLVEADGMTMAQAMKKSTLSFARTWFSEQYIWEEVERDGVLVREADAAQIRAALDFYRGYDGGGPSNNAKEKRRG